MRLPIAINPDLDGDGIDNLDDALPNDPTESVDTDGDGIGNNADLDDDNDSLLDTEELDLGTNPLSADTDGDGINDDLELLQGSSPLDPEDTPAALSNTINFEGVTTIAQAFAEITFSQNQFPWFIAPAANGNGQALRSAIITDAESSELTLTFETFGGELAFDFLSSSESNFDFFVVNVNDDQIISQSGTDIIEQRFSRQLQAGSFELRFVYRKDGSVSNGTDSAQIDNLTLPISFNADVDEDGVANIDDAFPLDPSESVDTDFDGLGNNADPDDDGDNLSDEQELLLGLDPLNPDADADGLLDGDEITASTDPRNADTDNDGVLDGNDAEPTNPNENADTDNDGIGDNRDNCEFVANVNQLDSNGDGIGNACDPSNLTVDIQRSLMINDLAVTADPSRTFDRCDMDGDGEQGNRDGVWSFKTLMAGLAGEEDVQVFTHRWLRTWLETQNINGFTIPQVRGFALQNFFTGWDGFNAQTLDIENLPFRLLAIVNRGDLARRDLMTSEVTGAETRFVFGLTTPSCNGGSFSIILEYANNENQCQSNIDHQNSWRALSGMPIGSPNYNASLENVLAQTIRPNAAPLKPRGSAISQVRTNEIETVFSGAPAPFLWEFRQFNLTNEGLMPSTIELTPDVSFKNSAILGQFVNDERSAIEAETHTVPERLNDAATPESGIAFLAASIEYDSQDFWNAPIDLNSNGEAMHKFSLNTCNGCHAAETNTRFVHIDPASPQGSAAILSTYLTGGTVTDPRTGQPRQFNELERRLEFNNALSDVSCATPQAIAESAQPRVAFKTSAPVLVQDVFHPSNPRRVH